MDALLDINLIGLTSLIISLLSFVYFILNLELQKKPQPLQITSIETKVENKCAGNVKISFELEYIKKITGEPFSLEEYGNLLKKTGRSIKWTLY